MKKELTKGEKKILLQFERFIKTEIFKEKVKEIRTNTELPKKGITFTKTEIDKLNDKYFVPKNFPLITKKNHKTILSLFQIRNPMGILNSEIRKLNDMLPVKNAYFLSLIRGYVLYNKFFYDDLNIYISSLHNSNVCEVTEAEEEFGEYCIDEDPENFGGFSIEHHNEKLEENLWRYPVSIRIHPEASQRDIMEYIRINWELIKNLQERYLEKNRISSFKNAKARENPRIKERNEFIYKNRRLPRKEIMEIVSKKYNEYLDQGTIGKIISLEKNKREKK